MQVHSLGQEDPLEEGMVTHSRVLVWRIPMDRRTWRATVHGVTKSQTRLRDFHSFTHSFISYLSYLNRYFRVFPASLFSHFPSTYYMITRFISLYEDFHEDFQDITVVPKHFQLLPTY